MCVACRRRRSRDWSLCTVCIWRLASEAAHAYDVERRHHPPLEAAARAITRLGAPRAGHP